MNQKYSDETVSLIVKIVLEYSDKISQVDYCKTYKIGLGEEITIDFYNNVRYVIGSGKYIFQPLEKGEIIAAVCTENGKAGMVFSLEGIYYRKSGMFCESSFTKYDKCVDIKSIPGLCEDEKFSKKDLEEMFCTFCKIFEISSQKEAQIAQEFRSKIEYSKDYFAERDEEIDNTNDCIQFFYDADYYGRYNKLGSFSFKEKKNLKREWDSRRAEMISMMESMNKRGSFNTHKDAEIREAILYALEKKYFLGKTFEECFIYCESSEEIRQKALAMFSGYDLHQLNIKYADADELIALVDLSGGDGLKGILFEKHEVLVKYASSPVGIIREIFYDGQDCYLHFSKMEITDKFDPRRFNYVLDKIHQITEGNI